MRRSKGAELVLEQVMGSASMNDVMSLNVRHQTPDTMRPGYYPRRPGLNYIGDDGLTHHLLSSSDGR